MPRWVPVVVILAGLWLAFAPTKGCESDGWTIPIPTPFDDKVDPETTAGSWVLVFEESSQRDKATIEVLTKRSWWDGLKDRGLKWRVYDKDESAAEVYQSYFSQIGLPALMVVDPSGKVLHKGTLPKSVDDLDSVVKKATGR